MREYGVKDVEKLLGLPRSTIRALIEAKFVSPTRGPRNSWRFSFQDLIVLRTAQALASAKVSNRRITRSLKELRRQLPESMPLSGLRIGAEADRVVVTEGGRRWQADSGQYLLAFEVNPAEGSLSVIERRQAPAPATDDYFAQGIALENENVNAALRAYERAIAAEPKHLDARVNYGRLLHESGRLAQAASAYRSAIKACGNDPLLWFNLGVLLEDLRQSPEAIIAYQAALRADPDFADAHFNLALLFEQFGKPREAIKHMSRYRRLVGGR